MRIAHLLVLLLFADLSHSNIFYDTPIRHKVERMETTEEKLKIQLKRIATLKIMNFFILAVYEGLVMALKSAKSQELNGEHIGWFVGTKVTMCFYKLFLSVPIINCISSVNSHEFSFHKKIKYLQVLFHLSPAETLKVPNKSESADISVDNKRKKSVPVRIYLICKLTSCLSGFLHCLQSIPIILILFLNIR